MCFVSARLPTVAFMGGECRMAGVAVATPTLPVPHQHFALLSLLATPTLTSWLIILCSGHTNFGNHPPPMVALVLRQWFSMVLGALFGSTQASCRPDCWWRRGKLSLVPGGPSQTCSWIPKIDPVICSRICLDHGSTLRSFRQILWDHRSCSGIHEH